jgi:hypothetical protein
MKTRLVVTVWLGVVMCAIASISAWADAPSLDITVDGPWIVYAKATFHNKDGKDAPVIVLMAPATASTMMKWPHLPPTFNEGDGYRIDPSHIFCLGFDGECAPLRKGAKFTTIGYPAGELLNVNVPINWVWYTDSYDNYGTYLVLPMPDSYSNDGSWYMRFGSDFSADGHTYTYYPKAPSIGIQLHYTSGATTLSLFQCQHDGGTRPSYEECDKDNVKLHGDLPNTGTVHITMKNRNFDNACDPHVREAYPMMLKLLDKTPLEGPTSTNVNKNIAYIDPAIDRLRDGTVKYDDNSDGGPKCRDGNNDPQKPTSQSRELAASENKKVRAEAMTLDDGANETTEKLVNQINVIAKSLKTDPKYTPYSTELLSSAITTAASELDPNFPTISQLSEMAQLLRSSAAAAERIGESKHLEDLLNLGNREMVVADDSATKDGKDCKAPIMLVQ